jgi:hypothetical protein
MGVWAMTAGDGVVTCELAEVTGAPFAFDATLTRDSTSDAAWVTLAGYSTEGRFDGQYFSSTGEARRVFAACGECATTVVETITVAVLSRSQTERLGGQCPADALDGGVPAPDDAGLTGPRQTAQGFDAVRLCGTLSTAVVAQGLPDGGACDPRCSACTTAFQLRGDRR